LLRSFTGGLQGYSPRFIRLSRPNCKPRSILFSTKKLKKRVDLLRHKACLSQIYLNAVFTKLYCIIIDLVAFSTQLTNKWFFPLVPKNLNNKMGCRIYPKIVIAKNVPSPIQNDILQSFEEKLIGSNHKKHAVFVACFKIERLNYSSTLMASDGQSAAAWRQSS
jgi:hypothetical protein